MYRYSVLGHLLFPPTHVDAGRLSAALAGKTVVITGASDGIGEQLAYRLAGTGAQLVLVARTEEKLHAVAAEVAARGGKAVVFAADLTNPTSVDALAAQLLQLPGGIDYFISNAGKSIRRPLFESLARYHDFTRTMGVNYLGPVALLLRILPAIVKSGGHIINVSSVSVLLPPAPRWAAYQASKAAFDQWFRSAAPELEVRGVHTTTVYLPLVRTRMIAPTAAYNNAPAMDPAHVAKKICRAMYSKQATVRPWWLPATELASLLLRKPWQWWCIYKMK